MKSQTVILDIFLKKHKFISFLVYNKYKHCFGWWGVSHCPDEHCLCTTFYEIRCDTLKLSGKVWAVHNWKLVWLVCFYRCLSIGGGHVSSDDHQVSLAGRVGMYRGGGVSMSREGDQVCPGGGHPRFHSIPTPPGHGTWDTPLPSVLTPSGSHQNMCVWWFVWYIK